MRGRAFLTSLLLLVPCAVDAKEKQQPWTFTAYFENDLFADTDQSYTNGVRFSWISPDISSYEHDPRLPSWVRTVNDQLRFFHGMNWGVTLRAAEPDTMPLHSDQRVTSEALVRLDFGPGTRPGVLAFGALDPDRFHDEQGGELLVFLGGAISRVMRRWLDGAGMAAA